MYRGDFVLQGEDTFAPEEKSGKSFFGNLFDGLISSVGDTGIFGVSPCHKDCNVRFPFNKEQREACKANCDAALAQSYNPNMPLPTSTNYRIAGFDINESTLSTLITLGLVTAGGVMLYNAVKSKKKKRRKR